MRFRTGTLIALLLTALFAANFSTAQLSSIDQPIEQISTPSALCSDLVEQAVAAVGPLCSGLGRNQACYGNRTVVVDFKPESNRAFNQSGDVVQLADIQRLTTAPLNPQTQDWGIAILKAQVNLPDALPGQSVTFLLFGDTTVDNPSPDMRAVTVSTRIGEPACVGAPNSGLLIQSPRGTQVAMTINGVEVTLGSTAFLTAAQNQEMAIGIVDGTGIINAMGVVRVVTPGGQVRVPLGGIDGLQASGQPSEPEPFDYDAISLAPLDLLDDAVIVPPPIGSMFATSVPTDTLVPCVPRADWTYLYVVPRGDTLSGIAARIGISTASLAAGNCISNPNRLFAGQTIRSPRPVPPPNTATPTFTPSITLTPSYTPTPTNTFTPVPPSINFSAQETTIPPNGCTTLNWSTTNATSISLDNTSVTPIGSMEVCPTATQTYTLTATGPGGTTNSSVTITVLPVCNNNGVCDSWENSDTCEADCGNPPVCGNSICEPGETFETCPADCG